MLKQDTDCALAKKLWEENSEVGWQWAGGGTLRQALRPPPASLSLGWPAGRRLPGPTPGCPSRRPHPARAQLAVHSSTHVPLTEPFAGDLKEEMFGARKFLNDTCGIPLDVSARSSAGGGGQGALHAGGTAHCRQCMETAAPPRRLAMAPR